MPLTKDGWAENEDFLFGVDLFNAGYYWEAHESWEAVWRGAEPGSPAADFFKGLIKLAAAGVKAREGRPAGVTRHARRAGELLCGVQQRISAATDSYFGQSLDPLIEAAREIEHNPQSYLDDREADVVVVFPLRLAPRA